MPTERLVESRLFMINDLAMRIAVACYTGRSNHRGRRETQMHPPEGCQDDAPDRFTRYAPIDPAFHSLQLGGPFTNCKICDRALVCVEVDYLIERIFCGSEPIVEYAMCRSCQNHLSSEMSEESMRSVQAFFKDIDFEHRMQRLRPYLPSFDDETAVAGGIAPWIDHCVVTGSSRDTCRGYQIVGLCSGTRMEVFHLPFMLSSDAVEQIVKMMSKATRERLEDFMGDFFGLPPEF